MNGKSSNPRKHAIVRKNLLRMLFTIYCSLFTIYVASAQSDTSFFFIQLADPQFGMYLTGRDFKHERDHARKAVEAINRLRPDFVVVCGDLVNKAGNEKQIRAFKEEFAKIDTTIPVYLVAGNHDVGNHPTVTSLMRYRQDFGADYYSFDRHGVHFIVLNSSLIKDPSKAPEEVHSQEDFLRKLFTLHPLPFTIVFLHHPLFLESPSESNSYFNLPKKARRHYIKLFEENGVRAVFAGHLHRNSVARTDSLLMVTTGPVGKPLGLEPSGFRIVTIRNGRIEHRYVPLDQPR